MPLSRDQQILLKRAQHQAGLGDAEYRDSIATVSGFIDCTSSTDPRLSDGVLDHLMSYFEAIYFRRFDAGELPPPDYSKKTPPVFQQRGYWAAKNQQGNTSRDRYTKQDLSAQIQNLEQQLYTLGFGFKYCQAIQRRINPFTPRKYWAALKRTVDSKQPEIAAPQNNDPY